MNKLLYSAILPILFSITAFAQTGELKGRFVDTLGEPHSFASLLLSQNGNPVMTGQTNFEGYFVLKPIQPGKYDLKFALMGFNTTLITDINIYPNKTRDLNEIIAKSSVSTLPGIDLVYIDEPIVKTEPIGTVLTSGEIDKMPYSDPVQGILSQTSQLQQSDQGTAIHSSGSRPEGNKVMLDDETMIGSMGISKQGVEQVEAIIRGTPAKYGDATGAIIRLTTRNGMRNKYFGGIDLTTSQFTDAYGYNFAGFHAGGPLFCVHDTDSARTKIARIGFFLSGEFSADKDPNPSAVGIYKVKDEKLNFLESHPLATSETGAGVLLNSELLRKEDMEKVKARQNVNKNTARFSGKIDAKAGKRTTFTLGGSMDYGRYHNFIYEYALLNPGNNPQYIYNTMRVYGKMTQHYDSIAVTKNKIIRNIHYTLQAGFSKYNQTVQDDSHKDRFFEYGHVGNFNTRKAPVFAPVTDSGGNILSYTQVAVADTLVEFSPGDHNPQASVYTEQYYDLFPGSPKTQTDIQQGYGLLNGDRPRSVYSIWYNTGRQFNGYNLTDQNQWRVSGNFSADVNSHTIQAGFEYERRNESYWSTTPIGLWTLARQLANRHITQLDTATNVPYQTVNGIPYYTHPYLMNGSEQTQFDKSFRDANGIANDVWVDIDSYDPEKYALSMFSPDELLNGGNSYVSYYGYSYDGKKNSGSGFTVSALEKYYKEKDGNGNFTRNTPSFQPVYMAGYIQDKFEIKDMRFNIGVRIDRFNANQPVLKDKYLLYEAYTAGEASGFSHPGNIPSGAVVYVDDNDNPGSVLGYRNGDTWYNSKGIEISDPAVITPSSGTIQPYLKYPSEKFLEKSDVANIFDSYKTQTTIMPRVAFDFPINTKANFFAHYDVLTQRPPSFLRFDPSDYLFIQSVGGTLNNPALKPERTTDYEVGFSQILDEKENSAVTLSAFYREMRDMIQIVNVFGAYPVKYTSFGNVDFGTVKGFTATYEMRRVKSVKLTASYTLQFAEGTGSAATSAAGIISAGQPNLRTTIPLDFDQRHSLVVNADYRLGSGNNYKGPQAKWAKRIFENFGTNISFRTGSGLPYSRQKNVTSGNGDNSSSVVFGINQRSSLKGKVNGSSLPWQYRIDLRIDKNLTLIWKNDKEEDKRKSSNLNIYLDVLNALNTRNILNLYRFTGDPDDDGYLSAPENQNGINNYLDPQSFTDLYQSKIANPSHYSIPRRIRIGFKLDF